MEFFIILSVIIIISSAITVILKKRIEKTIPIALISMILIVYICGIFDNLKLGIAIIKIVFILSLFLLFYRIIISIKKKEIKELAKKLITPGLLIYVILFIVFVIYNRQRIFQDLDEFNHWAVIIKDMFINNKYSMGVNSIIEYNEYPPFTPTLQYIFLQFKGGYAEDTIIIASNILYLSVIIPITSKIKWDKSILYLFIIVPIIIFLPTIFYEDFYINILVDGIIGILAGMIIFEIFTQQSKKDYILIGLEIISLGLIKPEGILLAICMIALVILLNIKRKKGGKVVALVISILAIIFVGIWYAKLTLSETDFYWEQQTGLNENRMSNDSIANGYIHAFLQANVTNGIQMAPLTIIALLLVYNIYTYYKIQHKRIKLKYLKTTIFIYAIDAIYFIGLLLTYQYILPSEDSQRLTSYNRYINTMIIMNIIFNISLFISNTIKNRNIKIKNIIIMLLCIIAVFPISNFSEKVINIKNYKMQELVKRKTYIKIQNYDKYLTNDDKILYVNMAGDEYAKDYKIARYLMMPIKVENMETEYFILDSDEFLERIKQEKITYIYIYATNNKFIEKFGKIFDNDIQEKTMYRLEENEQFLKLEV